MTEEPYRWLEAIGNRRDYVREQLKDGSPVLAASLPEGILLAGVGSGQSKVFELFDRHALAGLGHPADLEKIRQVAIDTAHVEAFTRAAEDVTLRRLVGFGLSPQLKTNFEQLFSAPFLVELIFAEVAGEPAKDMLLRLSFDGGFRAVSGGVVVAAPKPDAEAAAQEWLAGALKTVSQPRVAADLLLQAWWALAEGKSFDASLPAEAERQAGWRSATKDRVVELGWLPRVSARAARYVPLTLEALGL
jgi:proteasome alpha subunit